MNNKQKGIIKICNKMANDFLEIAIQFKSLSKSIERTTNKKELDLLYKIVKFKAGELEKYFENVKGGNN